MNVSEPEPDPNDEFSAPEEEDAPAPVPSSRSRGKKGKSRRSDPINWQKPVAILAGVALVIGLFVGVGYVVSSIDLSFLGAGNKIDLTYLDPEADFIVHARLSDAWNSPFMQSIVSMPAVKAGIDQSKSNLGIEPTEVASVTFGMVGFADQMKAAADFRKQMAEHKPGTPFPRPNNSTKSRALMVVRFKAEFDEQKFRDQTKLTEALEHQGSKYYRDEHNKKKAAFFPKSTMMVMGEEDDVKAAIERGAKTTRRPDLDFIDNSRQVLIAIVPKDSAVFDQSPPAAPGMPISLNAMNDVIRGKLKGFCLGVSAGEGLDLAAMTNCTTPEASKEIAAEIDKAIGEAKSKFAEQKGALPPQFAELINLADAVLNSVKTESSGSSMQMTAAIPGSAKSTLEQLPGMMMMGMMGGGGGAEGGANPLSALGGGAGSNNPSIESLGGVDGANSLAGLPGAAQDGTDNPLLKAREATQRAQSRNNLKQIALALHNIHDTIGSLPAYANFEAGKPLLSWRVHALPYLGQKELYDQFNLKESWDSPQNKALLARMPPVFRSPGSKSPPGMTNYLAARHARAAFSGNNGVKFGEIKDGTSSTILVVEASDAKAVPWTKPADFEFTLGAPQSGLTGLYTGGFNAAMCDGAVKFISDAIPQEMLSNLFTRDDGQPVPDF